MRVISISRRTDIPAFYTEWLMRRLRAGYCHVANPFNGRISHVSLDPADCLALVFWTRDPRPLLPHLPVIAAMGHRWYAQVTVTGYPRDLEPYAPPREEVLDACARLAAYHAPEFVVWRYDPILISTLTTIDNHLHRFAELARAWEGHTRRCVISFTDFYAKTKRNLARVAGLQWEEPTVETRTRLANALSEIAAAHGMTLHACCEADILGEHISQAHCVDAELIRRLRQDAPHPQPHPSRPGCGCAASVDIGVYHTCTHGCVYCYATSSHPTALAHRHAHDPNDLLLR